MAHTQRTSPRWLILLGAVLLVSVVAVVWVVATRNQGTNGTLQMVATEEEDASASDGGGWYTEDQANRGEEAYAQACARCHGEGLEGGIGPALTGDAFWDRWGGETVRTFFEVASQTMPQDDPGSLELETYTDITAYVLQTNGFPAGEEALPPEDDRLDELVIDRSLTTDEGEPEGEDAPADAETADDAQPSDAPRTEGEDDAQADEEAAGETTEPEAAGEPTAEDADASAEPTDERTVSTTFDGGWFADAQVQAGQTAFAENCARCHGTDLQGDPPLLGGTFPERYGTVWELYQYVSQTMPLDQPGSLRDPTYLDAIAYVLAENGYPMGEHRREPLRSVLIEMNLDTQATEPTTGEAEQASDGGADDDGPTEDGAAAAEDGASQEGGSTGSEEPASGEGSSGDGYFPQDQADRGQEAYAQHCAACHGDDLQGAPPLTGEAFLGNHETVWDLYEYARQNMPQSDPGSLEDETYADIVAHVLAENDFPAGGAELGPDAQDAMRELPLEAEAAGEQAESEVDGEGEGAPDAQSDDGRAEAEAQEGAAAAADDDEPPGGDPPELATLEIDARPANLTLNILGPDGLARRAVGAQTLQDLQPGRYVIAGSRGHESVTVNVRVAAGETRRVQVVLDELSRSTDVPEAPAVPLTEIPAIPKDPDASALIGKEPPAPIAMAQSTEAMQTGTAPNTEFAAGRGQQSFALHCARCHGADLQGNVAPALAGDVFFERWGGHPVDWLYFQARAAMPPHGAGFLTERTYADIITFVLTRNGVLEGFETFAPGEAAFRTLVIERGRTDDGRPALEEQVDRLRATLHGPQDDEDLGRSGPVLPVEWPDDPGIAPIGYRGRIDSASVVEAGDLGEPGSDAMTDEDAVGAATAEDGEDAEPTGEPDETPDDPSDDANEDPNDDGAGLRRPAASTRLAA